MGLLDMNDQGLLGLHMLAAASAKPRRTGFGEGLLGAIQGVQQQRNAEEDRKAKQQMQQMQMQEYQAQIAQRQAMAAEMQRKAQEAARIQSLVQGAVKPPISPSQAMAGGGGPSPANAAMVGQRPPIDYQRLIAEGVPVELVQKLAESANYGRQKVARVEETMQGGRPVKQQFDEFGGAVGDPLRQWKAPVMSDQGGAISALDPVTLDVLAKYQKTNSPDAVLSSITARRGQDMADTRAKEANETNKQAQRTQVVTDPERGTFLVDKGTGLMRPAIGLNGEPIPSESQAAAGKRTGQLQAGIKEARELLKSGPTGSYIGAGIDQAARVFGAAPQSAQTAAKLETISGWLVSNVPRMEGPQSNIDAENYKVMAARVGDRTQPVSVRMAALDALESLHGKYSGMNKAQPKAAPASGVPVLHYNPETGGFD